MKDTLRELGVNVGLTVAGFAGSLITVRDGHKSWGATITSLLAGTLSANYLTPVVVDWMNFKTPNTQYACAFILGFLGLHGVEFVLTKLGIRKVKDEKPKLK